jgi:hypothetical protein
MIKNGNFKTRRSGNKKPFFVCEEHEVYTGFPGRFPLNL